jgi:hypothetical protein
MIAIIEEMKTKMIKIIKTKAKMILPSSDRFRRLPYLVDNLPLVVTVSMTLNPNLFIDYIMYIL